MLKINSIKINNQIIIQIFKEIKSSNLINIINLIINTAAFNKIRIFISRLKHIIKKSKFKIMLINKIIWHKIIKIALVMVGIQILKSNLKTCKNTNWTMRSLMKKFLFPVRLGKLLRMFRLLSKSLVKWWLHSFLKILIKNQ